MEGSELFEFVQELHAHGLSLTELMSYGHSDSYNYKSNIQNPFIDHKSKHKIQRERRAEKKHERRVQRKEQKNIR